MRRVDAAQGPSCSRKPGCSNAPKQCGQRGPTSRPATGRCISAGRGPGVILPGAARAASACRAAPGPGFTPPDGRRLRPGPPAPLYGLGFHAHPRLPPLAPRSAGRTTCAWGSAIPAFASYKSPGEYAPAGPAGSGGTGSAPGRSGLGAVDGRGPARPGGGSPAELQAITPPRAEQLKRAPAGIGDD